MSDFRFRRDGEIKPREQMERAASAHDVPDEAVLAVLLKTGTVGCDVLEQARRLLRAFGGIQNLVSSDWRTLERRIASYNAERPEAPIKGLGRVKCLELAAAFELGFRGVRAKPEEVRLMRIRTAADAYRLFRSFALEGDGQEQFLAVPLDALLHPFCEPVRLFKGTVDSAEVRVREVFRDAIRWGARSIVVAHNHPSGDPEPSRDDLSLTKRLADAARLLGIDLFDHLVLGAPGSAGGRGYVSIRAAHPDLFAEHRARNAMQEAF